MNKRNGDKKVPRVSIVIPVYNSEKFVESTINSFINQTFQDFEIIKKYFQTC